MSKSICAQESGIIDHPRPCDSVESQAVWAVGSRGACLCHPQTPQNQGIWNQLTWFERESFAGSCAGQRIVTSLVVSFPETFSHQRREMGCWALWSLITWPAYHQPLKVGDLHRQNGKPVPVTEVWEDELTGARKSMRVVSSRVV